MRNAMAVAPAVFEPEEARVLESAVERTAGKLKAILGPDHMIERAELAKVIHDFGRCRLRLNKQLRTEKHAAEIADEAVEHLTYIEGLADGMVCDIREPGARSRPAERIVAAFPASFREPPTGRL